MIWPFFPYFSNTLMIKADDVKVDNSIDDNLQDEWDNIVRWSSSIHVPVNMSRCYVLNIVNKANLSVKPIVVEGSVILTQIDAIKIIGVQFSKDLTWNIHIDSVVKNACVHLFIIRKLRRSNCPRKLISKCYIAFIRLVLLYSYTAFCNSLDYLARSKLQNMKRHAFRIIDTPFDKSKNLFSSANKTCKKLFLDVLTKDDHALRELFHYCPSVRALRAEHIFRRPFSKTKCFSSSFTVDPDL